MERGGFSPSNKGLEFNEHRSYLMKILVIFLSVLFVGCAGPKAKGPRFSMHAPIEADESLVYVYKKSASDGVTACMKLLFNEVESGCLKGEGFIKTKLTPGVYELVLQTNALMGPRIIEYKFSVNSRSVYYYEFTAVTGDLPGGTVDSKFFSFGAISGHNVLVEKDPGSAIQELVILRESQ